MLPVSVLCKASGNMAEYKRLLKPPLLQLLKDRTSNAIKMQNNFKEIRVSFSYCIEFKNKNN